MGAEVKLTRLKFLGSFPAFFEDSHYTWPYPVFWYLTHHQRILKKAVNGCKNEQGNKYGLGERDRKP